MRKTKQWKTRKPARRSVQRMVVPLTPSRLYRVAETAYRRAAGMLPPPPYGKLYDASKAGWRALAEYLKRHNTQAEAPPNHER